MADTVRWGILGTGRIARAFATALRDTPGARLAAVASRSAATAQGFADDFGVPAAYGNYQALADASDVDMVYIATPHSIHASSALMMLEGGKAVLCEKPFTLNRREAEQVVALARSKKLFLMEAMWSRCMPALAEVRRLIAAGEIGTPNHISADFGFAADQDPAHRLNNPALGGGALLDLGIYPLSIAAALLGPVQSVQAQAELGPTGVDVHTGFMLRHEGGGMSVCSCSLRARTPCELTISGELGHIRMHTRFHRATTISVVTEAGSRTIATPYLGNGYVHEAIEAGSCWQQGLLESSTITHAETLALMSVLDDIRLQIGLRYEADDNQ
ncbi:MAG: Gfo/Idh/MocA family oxidoreductase [Pseudomonadota bacterium]